VITRSWLSRTRFFHHGRFWTFEDIVVEPPPAQQPHAPLWVAAGKPASIRRAAARGFNLILDQYASPEAIGERIAIYRTERQSHGLAFNPMQVAVARQIKSSAPRLEWRCARATGWTLALAGAAPGLDAERAVAAGGVVVRDRRRGPNAPL
jgi:alkanesulfonate monooxygenase SsuD/methylene tetrahydromethanopterin reductase-like flavin-dependent oxidoreductase (luciferase family)